MKQTTEIEIGSYYMAKDSESVLILECVNIKVYSTKHYFFKPVFNYGGGGIIMFQSQDLSNKPRISKYKETNPLFNQDEEYALYFLSKDLKKTNPEFYF